MPTKTLKSNKAHTKHEAPAKQEDGSASAPAPTPTLIGLVQHQPLLAFPRSHRPFSLFGDDLGMLTRPFFDADTIFQPTRHVAPLFAAVHGGPGADTSSSSFQSKSSMYTNSSESGEHYSENRAASKDGSPLHKSSITIDHHGDNKYSVHSKNTDGKAHSVHTDENGMRATLQNWSTAAAADDAKLLTDTAAAAEEAPTPKKSRSRSSSSSSRSRRSRSRSSNGDGGPIKSKSRSKKLFASLQKM